MKQSYCNFNFPSLFQTICLENNTDLWHLSSDTGCVQIQKLGPPNLLAPYATTLRRRPSKSKISSDAADKRILLLPKFEGQVWWILLSPPYPIMHSGPTGEFFSASNGGRTQTKRFTVLKKSGSIKIEIFKGLLWLNDLVANLYGHTFKYHFSQK